MSTIGAPGSADHALIPSVLCVPSPRGTVCLRPVADLREPDVHQPEFACLWCSCDWHSLPHWLTAVTQTTTQHLLQDSGHLAVMAWLGEARPTVSSPKLTRTSVAFLMWQRWARIPPLMRTFWVQSENSFVWRMRFLLHFCWGNAANRLQRRPHLH